MREIKIQVEDEEFGFLFERLYERLMNDAEGDWAIEEIEK